LLCRSAITFASIFLHVSMQFKPPLLHNFNAFSPQDRQSQD
jgi:hypothetical protein